MMLVRSFQRLDLNYHWKGYTKRLFIHQQGISFGFENWQLDMKDGSVLNRASSPAKQKPILN